MINIYTKNNCMPCKMTKKWLSNHDLDFHEINVDEDLDAYNYLMANNLRTLPVVFNDSELIALGFQPHKLKTLLN
ncbi:DNA methylase [Enterococcus phage vB_EfaS-DELF1]|uniref:DNA methylase n=1 Tax=Enterococcus phage vB_EfaS-DELF1 TaxID=2683673 RepID=A0A5S9MLJ7_9CAUD|nr:DNA methylase [Enterococcus phage vB_EfaS-DELF1]